MSIAGNTVLAVVPARGGSKSIPRKNLARLDGRTLIAHAAAVAASLPWIDRAVLSTDDDEIAEEGRSAGLLVPFMRPAALADDFSTSVDMWRHAWLTCEMEFAIRFDISILLEPTSPLRRPDDVAATVNVLIESGSAAAATVSPTPAHYTPHKTLTVSDECKIGFYLETGAKHSIRQTIPQYYHRNGICYAVRRSALVDNGTIIEEDCTAIIIDRPVVNIDEAFDLTIAEALMGRQD